MYHVVANLDPEPRAFVSGTSESATNKMDEKGKQRHEWVTEIKGLEETSSCPDYKTFGLATNRPKPLGLSGHRRAYD